MYCNYVITTLKNYWIDQGKCQTVDIPAKESSQSMQDKLH